MRQLLARCEGHIAADAAAAVRRTAVAEISGLNWKWVKLIKCRRRRAAVHAPSCSPASPRDLASFGRLNTTSSHQKPGATAAAPSLDRYLMTSLHRRQLLPRDGQRLHLKCQDAGRIRKGLKLEPHLTCLKGQPWSFCKTEEEFWTSTLQY